MSRQILEQITAEKSLITRRFDPKIFIAYSRPIYKSHPPLRSVQLMKIFELKRLVFNDFPTVIRYSICLLMIFQGF